MQEKLDVSQDEINSLRGLVTVSAFFFDIVNKHFKYVIVVPVKIPAEMLVRVSYNHKRTY